MSATNVTTPVDVSSVNVPSPAIVTIPSASHDAVLGVYRHVADVLKLTGVVARPPVPVTVVKAVDPPGITIFVCGVATGAAGIDTAGVIVALAS
jgi:hypothetical protein